MHKSGFVYICIVVLLDHNSIDVIHTDEFGEVVDGELGERTDVVAAERSRRAQAVTQQYGSVVGLFVKKKNLSSM